MGIIDSYIFIEIIKSRNSLPIRIFIRDEAKGKDVIQMKRTIQVAFIASIVILIVVFVSISNFTGSFAESEKSNFEDGSKVPDPEDYRCPGCNVILISIDSLRADHLGCYGYFRDTAPNICGLAEGDGILFEDMMNSGGATLQVHMSMMTSLYPEVHGVSRHDRNITALEEERITLAEQLRESGYETAGFTGGGLMRPVFGFGQGFDLYDSDGRGFEQIMPKVYDWLDENQEEHFFLFIHTYDVHAGGGQGNDVYSSPGGYDRMYIEDHGEALVDCSATRCINSYFRILEDKFKELPGNPFLKEEVEELKKYVIATYDGGIAYVDNELGKFLGKLKELGVYEKTLIIITSDHGEEFLEHGSVGHANIQYQELTHIPMIMKLPDSMISGRRIPQLVSIIDIMPTVLELVGIEVNEQTQGKSMAPLIFNGRSIRDSAYMVHSIRTQDWKMFPERNELYSMETDGEDRFNVIDEYPEIAKSLSDEFDRLLERDRRLREEFLSMASSQEELHISRELRDELKSLGYMV